MYKFIKHFNGEIIDIVQKKTSGKNKKAKLLRIMLKGIKEYIQSLDLENDGWTGWTQYINDWDGWVEGFESAFTKDFKIGDTIKINILIDKKENSDVFYINFYSPNYVPDKFLSQLNSENIEKILTNQNIIIKLLEKIKI